MVDFFDEMGARHDVAGWLRRYVVGRLHIGELEAGAALPSIRRLAAETGVDHRRVADAYRTLAAEGLVEIREGAGVYVARSAGAESVRGELSRWAAATLYAGWSRRMTPGAVRRLMTAATRRTLRCAVMESTRDHAVALGAELESDFELEVVHADADDPDTLTGEQVDLVAGTAFVSEAVTEAAERLEVPGVVVAVDGELAREVVRRLEAGPVVAVVSDARFEARVRDYMAAGPYARRIRTVLSGTLERLADVAAPRGASVLATRAARRDLGEPEYHLVPGTRFVAPASARDLLDTMVRLRGLDGM